LQTREAHHLMQPLSVSAGCRKDCLARRRISAE
jgi:hypothetical protein